MALSVTFSASSTASQNLKGLAVDATTVLVWSPVSFRYCSNTWNATAVWVSMRYLCSSIILPMVASVSASLEKPPTKTDWIFLRISSLTW